jgi:hypothetical protein
MVTGVFLSRTGGVKCRFGPVRFTEIIVTGLPLMGWRGKIGRGIG